MQTSNAPSLLSVVDREQVAAAETLVGWMTRVWNRRDQSIHRAYLMADLRDRVQQVEAHPDHAFRAQYVAEARFMAAAVEFLDRAQREWAVFDRAVEAQQEGDRV